MDDHSTSCSTAAPNHCRSFLEQETEKQVGHHVHLCLVFALDLITRVEKTKGELVRSLFDNHPDKDSFGKWR